MTILTDTDTHIDLDCSTGPINFKVQAVKQAGCEQAVSRL